jgi:hypothetical protein
MRVLKSLEEANEISAVRLTEKRRFAKVGDIFRLSPHPGVYLWGRLIKRPKFFGVRSDFNLVYIYDFVGAERPDPGQLIPQNLMIGPVVVNNLGWIRGYWEIVASEPILPSDVLDRHLLVRSLGTGSVDDYDLVGEDGRPVEKKRIDSRSLSQSGFGNFNSVDWTLRGILRERGVIPRD